MGNRKVQESGRGAGPVKRDMPRERRTINPTGTTLMFLRLGGSCKMEKTIREGKGRTKQAVQGGEKDVEALTGKIDHQPWWGGE